MRFFRFEVVTLGLGTLDTGLELTARMAEMPRRPWMAESGTVPPPKNKKRPEAKATGLFVFCLKGFGWLYPINGDILYLAVKGNSRRWLYHYQVAGKRNELSLGPFQQISLKYARAHSKELNAAQARGEDVRMVRNRILNKVETVPTFEDCATALIKINRPSRVASSPSQRSPLYAPY